MLENLIREFHKNFLAEPADLKILKRLSTFLNLHAVTEKSSLTIVAKYRPMTLKNIKTLKKINKP